MKIILNTVVVALLLATIYLSHLFWIPGEEVSDPPTPIMIQKDMAPQTADALKRLGYRTNQEDWIGVSVETTTVNDGKK